MNESENNSRHAILSILEDQRKTLDSLRESEAYSRALFEHAAVPIWVEDFSEVKIALDELKEKGIKDFNKYFTENMSEVKRIAAGVKILDINKKSLELYEADSKEELLTSLGNWFIDETWHVFKDELVTLANGGHSFEAKLPVITPKGKIKQLLLNLNVHPDHYESLKIVFASFIDITDRIKAEEEIKKFNEELEQLVNERTKEIVQKNAELERMNKLFVGREFRIKELKDEIQRLKE